jgi:photoactive yellow protein
VPLAARTNSSEHFALQQAYITHESNLAMAVTDQELLDMSASEVNALPQGIVRLDATGKILYYSQTQATFTGRTVADTIGKNFFTDVAPCTAVKNFQGRFLDFVARPGALIESFVFLFRFATSAERVNITFLRQADLADSVCIVVNQSRHTQ